MLNGEKKMMTMIVQQLAIPLLKKIKQNKIILHRIAVECNLKCVNTVSVYVSCASNTLAGTEGT